MARTSISITYSLNMCDAQSVSLSRTGNDLIAVPAEPTGSWYIVCSNNTLADLLRERLNAKLEITLNGNPVVYVSCENLPGNNGKGTNESVLKKAFRKMGLSPRVTNRPPWK